MCVFMQCWLSYFAIRKIYVTSTETQITVIEEIYFFSVSWEKKEGNTLFW